MQTEVNRRDFLKAMAGTAALAVTDRVLGAAQHADLMQGRYAGGPVEEIPSLCEMCYWRCGILGTRRDGRLLGIAGNPDHPMNQGRLCARGQAGMQLLYDPDRLKYPLIRVGARGEGRWRQASWDEALDRVAAGLHESLEQHGPGAVAYFPHGIATYYFKRLMKRLGVYHHASPSFGQCRGPRDVGYKLTFGMTPGSPERLDFEHTAAIFLLGSHLGENVHTSQVLEFSRALRRGARLIVVDPRYSVAADKAHLWLPIRPGTDLALLLALIRYLIVEGLYDEEQVARYCTGFAELQRAVAHATPEWAAAITDLPVAKIVATARMLGAARPRTVIHPGRFTAWHGNDTQRSRALAILTALLGAWGRAGGIFLPSPLNLGPPCCSKGPDAPVPGARPPFATEGEPFQDIVRATLADDQAGIKLWFLYGSNLLQSMPDQSRTIEAMHRLDHLFMVDIFPTEAARYADVILPESTYLERYDAPLVVTNAKQPFAALRQPLTEPLYESRDPYWIARQLARRLEIDDCLQCASMQEALDRQFWAADSSLDEVRHSGLLFGEEGVPYFGHYRRPRFATPSRKIELHSARLADAGLDAVPHYRPLASAPAGFVRLVNGRSPQHSFTRTLNNPWLTELDPVNELWINDRMASMLGLDNGDPVEIENQDGVRTGPVPLKVTPGIRPEIVFLPHGWAQQAPGLRIAYGKGASDNRLMSRFAEDPETGATGLRVNFVRLVHHGKVLDMPPPERFGIAPEPPYRAPPPVTELMVEPPVAEDWVTEDEAAWDQEEDWEFELEAEEGC